MIPDGWGHSEAILNSHENCGGFSTWIQGPFKDPFPDIKIGIALLFAILSNTA
jgi:hypothetical protein